MPATRASNSEKHLGLPDKPRTRRSSAQVQADAAAKVAAVKQKTDEKAATLKRLAKMEDKKAEELEEKKKRVYTPAKTKQGKKQSEVVKPQEMPAVEPQEEAQAESDVRPKKSVIKNQPYRKEVRHSDDSEVELVWTSGTEWETDSDQSPGSPWVFGTQIEGTIMDPVLHPELLLPLIGTPPKKIRKKIKEKNKEARQEIRNLREVVPVVEEMDAEDLSPVKGKTSHAGKKRAKNGSDDDRRSIYSPGVNAGYLQAVENLSWQSGTTSSTLKSTISSASASSATHAKGGRGKAPQRSAEDTGYRTDTEEENIALPPVLSVSKTVGSIRTATSSKAPRQAARKHIPTDIGSEEEELFSHVSLPKKTSEAVKVKQNGRGLPAIVEAEEDEISSLTESDEEASLVSALPTKTLHRPTAPATSRKADVHPPAEDQAKNTNGPRASTARQVEKRKADDDLSDKGAPLDRAQIKKVKYSGRHELTSTSEVTSRKRMADDTVEDPINTSPVVRKKPRPKPTGAALLERNLPAPKTPHSVKTYTTPRSARKSHDSPIVITSDDDYSAAHDSRGYSRGPGKPAHPAGVVKKAKAPAFRLEVTEEDERIGCFEGDEEAERQAARASPPKTRARPTSEGMVKRVAGSSKTLQLPTQAKAKGKYLEVDVKEEDFDSDLPGTSVGSDAGQRHEEKGKGKQKGKAADKEKEKKQRTLNMLPFQVRKVWPQFAQSFENWAACQKQPFDLDDDDVVDAVQTIYDCICGGLQDTVFTVECQTVKQCKQRLSSYKNMMSRAAVLVVDAHFNTRANQERFTSMSERVKYCTEQLDCHNFIFETLHPRCGTFMSKEVLCVFANHYQRMRSSPGPAVIESFGKMYPIGGLNLAATALYRAYDLYSEKRYEFVQELGASPLPKKVCFTPQANPNTGTNKDTSTFFSEDKYGEAAQVYATFVETRLVGDVKKLKAILAAAEFESRKYKVSSVARSQSVAWREAIPPLLGSDP
ncbi:hypothetical protein CERSUDRAFT_95729 [Gelatoporia subvermispora B]|uniref:Uncharacterized protein n=1 Tax=Ceriporiopsis subvermispora (strain B) TaxID=914234 RepID=M2PJQ3_CERS8|nr:hypothetical protein CERSUDRAFT_95729 [Gelatoporia subvermispora B]